MPRSGMFKTAVMISPGPGCRLSTATGRIRLPFLPKRAPIRPEPIPSRIILGRSTRNWFAIDLVTMVIPDYTYEVVLEKTIRVSPPCLRRVDTRMLVDPLWAIQYHSNATSHHATFLMCLAATPGTVARALVTHTEIPFLSGCFTATTRPHIEMPPSGVDVVTLFCFLLFLPHSFCFTFHALVLGDSVLPTLHTAFDMFCIFLAFYSITAFNWLLYEHALLAYGVGGVVLFLFYFWS